MEEISSTSPGVEPAAARSRAENSRDRNSVAICAALLLIGMPVGYLPGSTGDAIGLAVLSLVSLVLMAGIVFWLAPRQRAAPVSRARRSALILGILSVLFILVFWTGLPFAFGAGAIALGLSLRESAPPAARAQPTAAVVLGVLAVVASFVALLIG